MPFYSGPTHSQELTNVFRELIDFPILEPKTPEEAIRDYKKAQNSNRPIMVVERKSCYDQIIKCYNGKSKKEYSSS